MPVRGRRDADSRTIVPAIAAARNQLGERGRATDGRGQCEHPHLVRDDEARKLVARVRRERARAQEGDAAEACAGGGIGVIAHRPARQPHQEAVLVWEEPRDGA
jgi:hypothetical protein